MKLYKNMTIVNPQYLMFIKNKRMDYIVSNIKHHPKFQNHKNKKIEFTAKYIVVQLSGKIKRIIIT